MNWCVDIGFLCLIMLLELNKYLDDELKYKLKNKWSPSRWVFRPMDKIRGWDILNWFNQCSITYHKIWCD
jgi:hypothetical protein